MSRYNAFDLLNRNFVFEKEKEHIGSKLTEGVGLTSVGRDELLLVRFFRNHKATHNPDERELVPTATKKTFPGQQAAQVSSQQERSESFGARPTAPDAPFHIEL